MTDAPSVLLGCDHNASRSQIATGFLTELSAGGIEIRSAGSPPADQVNPAAVQAMAEIGIDITAEVPKLLTTEAIRASDVVITMGCELAIYLAPSVHGVHHTLRLNRGARWTIVAGQRACGAVSTQ